MKKSLIALLVVLTLIVSVSVFSVSAAETKTTAEILAADYSLETGICPHCDTAWSELNPVEYTGQTATGHYVMNADYTKTISTVKNTEVVIHMNGNKMTGGGGRAITHYTNGKLYIVDAKNGGGKITGATTANTSSTGGVIRVDGAADNKLYLYNIEVVGAPSWKQGGAIWLTGKSDFYMYGGKVSGGSAVDRGGNICMTNNVKATIAGEVTGGTVTGGIYSGGNIYVENGCVLTLEEGAQITNGSCTASGSYGGGNIGIRGTGSLVMNGGTVSGGSAVKGGNIFKGGSGDVILNGGIIDGGASSGTQIGGNLCIEDTSKLFVKGATISNGYTYKDTVPTPVYDEEDPTKVIGYSTVNGAGRGGNITMRGSSTMEMTSGTISGGSAPNGANIAVDAGASVTISGGTVSGGFATTGGNVYLNGTNADTKAKFTLSDTGNIANGTAATCGGVYANAYATVNINGGYISNNKSTNGGASLRFNSSSVSWNMTAGTITGGTVTSTSTSISGGNVFLNVAAPVNITGGTISNGQTLNYGGNICITNIGANSTIKNLTISDGISGTGGNLDIATSVAIRLTDCTISGGAGSGAGIYMRGGANGSLTLDNTVVKESKANAKYNNTTTKNTVTGGGIFIESGHVYLTNGSKIIDNVAMHAGGVVLNAANAKLTMAAGTEISGNDSNRTGSAKPTGGNVMVKAGTFTMNGGSIANGLVTSGAGATVGNASGGNVYMIGGTFAFNAGTISGGIAQVGESTMTAFGGNVCLDGGAFNMAAGTTISGGIAQLVKNAEAGATAKGGNVAVLGGTFTMNGGTITEGTAKNSGGNFAIDAAEATLDINGGSIEGGEAPSGGSFWINNGTVTVDNATIDGGSATIGGNITFNGGSAAFTNCEILNGTSVGNGGNIAVNGEGATFTGCEILNGVAGTKVVDEETGAIAKPSTDARGGNLAIGDNTTLTNCVIRNGESWSVSNPNGGNIYAVTGDNIILDGCTITGGICYAVGGNICLHGNTTVMTIKGDSYIQGGISANSWGGNIGYSNTATLKLEGDTVVDGSESRCHKNAQYGNNIGMSAAGKLYVSGNAKVINGDNQYEGTTLGGNRWSVAVVAATDTAVPKIYFAENGSIDSIFLRGQSAVACDDIIVLQAGWTGATQVRTNFSTYNNSVAPGEAVYAAVTKEDGYTGTGSLKVTKGSGTGTGYITFVDTADSILKVAGITGFKVYNKGAENEYTVENGFGSLDAVVDAGMDYAKLYVGGTYTLSAKTDNFPIDMNNQVVTFNTGSYKLHAIDYRTDGHVVAKYTKITVDKDENVVLLTQNPINNYQYLNVKGDDGKWTSNRVTVKLEKVSIKTTKDGVYYTTNIAANANAAPFLVDYGTAVSLVEMPGADFIDVAEEKGILYTAFDLHETDNFSIHPRSALITGILSSEEDAATNTARAQMKIYANSFVTAMVGGEEVKIMADETSELSFEDIMVMLDDKIDELNRLQPEGYADTIATAVKFYDKWSFVFGTWTNLPNLKAEAEKAA